MKIFNLIITITTLVTFSQISSAFEVIKGEITEISGPDDLNLDPANTILAVDVFGDTDRTINDVEFYTDRSGLGELVTGEGTVEKDGVIITTTAPNQIDNWAGPQNFTGQDADSASNLSEVMRDIRWQGAPNPLTVDISGLTGGSTYNLNQLTTRGNIPTTISVESFVK